MPGADLSIQLQSLGDRGIRSPRHLGAVHAHGQQILHPWMIAPVRPGETFVGASLQGTSWHNMIMNAIQAPMMWCEVGLWYIPLGAMGEWMQQLITNTGDDLEDATGTTTISGSMGLGEADTANEPGLQNINRPWAGEPATPTDLGLMYLPVGSRGTYKVASDWYGLNNSQHVNVDSRYDNPPQVDEYVMSAARVRADLQGFADPNPSTATSSATILEKISLLTRTEVTYAEYLAAHGVDPRRGTSISTPLMIEHGYLAPQPDPHFVTGFAESGVNNANDQALYEATVGGGQAGTASTSLVNAGFVYGNRPMASHFKHWNTFRTKAMPIPEPGIILGTVVFYVEPFGASNAGAASFDATRLINGSLWGDRSFGGIDEDDFLAVLDLAGRDGASIDQAIWNMLHLYVNGDVFGYGELTTGNPFAFRDVTGRGYDAAQNQFDVDCTTKLSAQLHILSDLVGGG